MQRLEVSTPPKRFMPRNLRMLALWFLGITVVIVLYADDPDPMPVSIFSRLLVAAGIVAFLNIPFGSVDGLDAPPDGIAMCHYDEC